MSIDQPLEALNERELEIIPLLAEGLSNKEIADRLFLAPSTVKWYVRQLNSKLDTSSRDEIVERAKNIPGLMTPEKEEKPYLRPRQNLPRQTTPFIGRDAELDEIHSILENPDVRLLTILAQGGMGKTRIALEATEQQSNHFLDGVYFVGLQALSDIANIVPQIASATAFQFSSDGTEQKEQILDFLSDKKMLLCIDNWEHLLEGATLLNEILTTAPHVKIIATSREKLNLMGETVYVLKGMQFPAWETPEDALKYDAVQLLVQSAKRIQADWTVTEENLDYVARICRLTEGMPLGILLATSWLDIYPLERIAEEIQNSADILESDMRDIPERQRSIRAVFEYSWEKLRPQEQSLLMKMSVFRGGCSLKAVETITGANARILQGLVNKSLLTRNKEGRYDIHELLRQYAESYLNHTDTVDDVRDAHMQYYANAIHEREKHLQDARQFDAVNDIDSDFENVRLAWLWAVHQKRFDLIEKMQFSLQIYSRIRIRYDELNELFHSAVQQLEKVPENNSRLMQAKLETAYARIQSKLGNFHDGEKILQSTLQIFREENDVREQACCLYYLADTLTAQYQHEEALSLILEAYDLSAQVGWQWLRGNIAHNTGYLYGILGKQDQLFQYTEESYRIHKEIGNTHGLLSIMNNMAGVARHRNDTESARRYLYQGLEMAREHKIYERIIVNATALSMIELSTPDLESAEKYAYESLKASRKVHNKAIRAYAHHSVATTALFKGDTDTALQFSEIAYQLSLEGGHWGILTSSLRTYALSLALSSMYDEALNIVFELLQSDGEELNDDDLLVSLFPIFAQYLAHKGENKYAIELLGLLHSKDELPLKIPGLRAFENQLRQELGEETYHSALEHGKSLDVKSLIQDLIDKFGDTDS